MCGTELSDGHVENAPREGLFCVRRCGKREREIREMKRGMSDFIVRLHWLHTAAGVDEEREERRERRREREREER